ncbi:Fc receptor-like protein 5 [Protopterus annectens]|uniref:Fc receptor-like protein 5 n=1 Tax=Protopterus annectens TaxID=7888 RepID=UPI001CF98F66|nr:Fc receptor-like protein 5 [Protopterus annectens]
MTVTDTPEKPTLTVMPVNPIDQKDKPMLVYIREEPVTLQCDTSNSFQGQMYSFYKDESEIQEKQTSQSLHVNVSGRLRSSNSVSYTCKVWKQGSNQGIESPPSEAVSLTIVDRPVTPTISVTPNYPVYIRDEPVTLQCSTSDFYKGQMFTFYKDEFEIKGKQTSEHLQIKASGSSTSSNSVSFTCTVWKRESNQEIESLPSEAVSLKLVDRPVTPTISVDPRHDVYVRNERVTLQCSTSYYRYENMKYSFYKGQSEIQGKQPSQSLDIVVSDSSAYSNSVSYTCTLSKRVSKREIESLPSEAVSLTIVDRPVAPTISFDPRHDVYVRNERVTLRCSTSYYWYKDTKYSFYKGQSVIQGKQPSQSLDIVVSDSSISYTCTVWKWVSKREIESLLSEAVSLTIVDRPVAPTISVDPRHDVYGRNERVTLRCYTSYRYEDKKYSFYKGQSEIQGKQPSQSLETVVSGISTYSNSVSYTCTVWQWVSKREIESLLSEALSLTIVVPVIVLVHSSSHHPRSEVPVNTLIHSTVVILVHSSSHCPHSKHQSLSWITVAVIVLVQKYQSLSSFTVPVIVLFHRTSHSLHSQYQSLSSFTVPVIALIHIPVIVLVHSSSHHPCSEVRQNPRSQYSRYPRSQ